MRAGVIVGGLVVCLGLSACATAPKLSPDELERRISGTLVSVRDVDAKLAAFRSASAKAPPPASKGSRAQEPYYNAAGMRMKPIDPQLAQWARDELAIALERRGAARFEYRTPKGRLEFGPPWPSQRFEGVPLEVQFAAIYAAAAPLRGAETDVRVPIEPDSSRLVTIWNETGDQVEVADALASALPPVAGGAPQAEQLRARYGVGPIEGWSPAELAALEQALSRLSAEELAVVAGLPLTRDSEPSGEFEMPKIPEELASQGGTHCGLFIYKDVNRWIEIYDCAFRTDEALFVGNPDQPTSPAVRAILHELGHAIGKKQMLDIRIAMTASHHATTEVWEEYNRQAQDVPGGWRRRFRGMGADLTSIGEIVNGWAEVAKLQSLGDSKEMQSFDQVRGGAGFTVYGRSSSDEAFAEAFSLYRADPDALRRISPEVFAFFEAGRHIPASR